MNRSAANPRVGESLVQEVHLHLSLNQAGNHCPIFPECELVRRGAQLTP